MLIHLVYVKVEDFEIVFEKIVRCWNMVFFGFVRKSLFVRNLLVMAVGVRDVLTN